MEEGSEDMAKGDVPVKLSLLKERGCPNLARLQAWSHFVAPHNTEHKIRPKNFGREQWLQATYAQHQKDGQWGSQ